MPVCLGTHEEGRPQRPDWSELTEIRRRQELVALQSQAGSADKEESAALLMACGSDAKDFIDFLGGLGQRPFEDHEDREDLSDAIVLPWISADALCTDASFLALHPRLRHEIVKQMELQHIPDPAPKRSKQGTEG